MPINLIVFVAALFVSFLLFRWLFTVIKSTVINLATITLIIVLLQFAFGITFEDLFREIINLPQRFQEILSLFENIFSIQF